MVSFRCFELGEMAANCVVVYNDEKDAVLVDCGGDPAAPLAFIQAQGLHLHALLLTHGHVDHIAGVAALLEHHECPLYAHRLEAPLCADPALNLSFLVGAPLSVSPTHLLEDDEVLTFGSLSLRAAHTPGHTPGSVCFLCESLLLSGDTLFFQGIGRTDMPAGDEAALYASLRRLSALPGDYTVIPGHGTFTLLSRERALNPALQQG